MLHLAIFSHGSINDIFTGKKTLDARFSKIRCKPYGAIEKGDLVLMKRSGGKLLGYFVAGEVKFFKDLSPIRLEKLVKKHWNKLSISEEFWKERKDAKYLTLIEITKPTKFRTAVNVVKKDLSGWVSLGGGSQRQIEMF